VAFYNCVTLLTAMQTVHDLTDYNKAHVQIHELDLKSTPNETLTPLCRTHVPAAGQPCTMTLVTLPSFEPETDTNTINQPQTEQLVITARSSAVAERPCNSSCHQKLC